MVSDLILVLSIGLGVVTGFLIIVMKLKEELAKARMELTTTQNARDHWSGLWDESNNERLRARSEVGALYDELQECRQRYINLQHALDKATRPLWYDVK